MKTVRRYIVEYVIPESEEERIELEKLIEEVKNKKVEDLSEYKLHLPDNWPKNQNPTEEQPQPIRIVRPYKEDELNEGQ